MFFFYDTSATANYTYCHTLSRHYSLPILPSWRSTAEFGAGGTSTGETMSSARMRPSAWCSATGSLDVTGVMISASSLRASSTRMSGPPWAKQSSVSWAMGLFRGAGARLGLQPAVGADEVGDRLAVVGVEARHRPDRQIPVGGPGDEPGVGGRGT